MNRPIVLVCEDDSLVRMVIVDHLITTVAEARSGEEAVVFIDGPDQQRDVLFTDIRLGGPKRRQAGFNRSRVLIRSPGRFGGPGLALMG
jgi:CheY-like chemotaxis protein